MQATIFRFDQLKYAKPFVEEGLVSFGPAAAYNDSKLSDAQRDNELRRNTALDPASRQIAVSLPGGQPQMLKNLLSIKFSYDIRDVTGHYLRYHILCCSLCDDTLFYSRFPVDCCITIHDQPEFQRRLDVALCAQLPDWGVFSRRVEYFAPDAVMSPETTLDLVFMKDAGYAWQQEFRYVLISPLDQAHSNRVALRLGSLKDICSIATK
jgi:hypothetical protein